MKVALKYSKELSNDAENHGLTDAIHSFTAEDDEVLFSIQIVADFRDSAADFRSQMMEHEICQRR